MLQSQSQRMEQRILKSQVTGKLFCKFTDHRVFFFIIIIIWPSQITGNTSVTSLRLIFNLFTNHSDFKKAQPQVTKIPPALLRHLLPCIGGGICVLWAYFQFICLKHSTNNKMFLFTFSSLPAPSLGLYTCEERKGGGGGVRERGELRRKI